jgi:hypothetical protein
MRNVHKILVRNLGIDGRIILEWILKRMVEKLWTGFTWLRIGTSGRTS